MMRVFVWLAALTAFLSSIYKWRYPILNVLMSIKGFRRIVVAISFKIPTFRNRVMKTISQK